MFCHDAHGSADLRFASCIYVGTFADGGGCTRSLYICIFHLYAANKSSAHRHRDDYIAAATNAENDTRLIISARNKSIFLREQINGIAGSADNARDVLAARQG